MAMKVIPKSGSEDFLLEWKNMQETFNSHI